MINYKYINSLPGVRGASAANIAYCIIRVNEINRTIRKLNRNKETNYTDIGRLLAERSELKRLIAKYSEKHNVDISKCVTIS